MSTIDKNIDCITDTVAEELFSINRADLSATWYLQRVCCAIEQAQAACMAIGYRGMDTHSMPVAEDLASMALLVDAELQDMHEDYGNGMLGGSYYMDQLAALREAIRDVIWGTEAL